MESSTDPFIIGLIFFIAALFAGTDSALDTLRGALLQRALGNHASRRATHALLQRWQADPIPLVLLVRLIHGLALLVGAAWAALLFAEVYSGEAGLSMSKQALGILTALGAFVGIVAVEVVPRVLARHRTDAFLRIFPLVSLLLRTLHLPLLPIVGIRRGLARWLGGEETRPAVTEEDIEVLVKRGGRDGGLDKDQEALLAGILAFNDTYVREVMVPRNETVCFEVGSSLMTIFETVRERGFSRYPVYEETPDRIIGIIHVKDMFGYLQGPWKGEFALRTHLREAYFVPETKRIDELMRELQHHQAHIAVVVDEFGGTAGIATQEDIIEEVFGEIYDEHDAVDEPEIQRLGEGRYLIDCRILLKDVEEFLGVEFPAPVDYDTLGGFIADLAGGVPQVGDEVTHGTLRYIVREGDSTRVRSAEAIVSSPDEEKATA